jgi:hypothetical protein
MTNLLFLICLGEYYFLFYFNNNASVARERRRGDRPPTKYKCKFNGGIYIWSMWGDKEFFVS